MEWKDVKIPITLYNKLKELATKTGFEDPNTLLIHLLREAVANLEEEIEETSISEEEKKEIIERLRSLGYL